MVAPRPRRKGVLSVTFEYSAMEPLGLEARLTKAKALLAPYPLVTGDTALAISLKAVLSIKAHPLT